ncbi:MAG: helix-turn-helix transcriptional regulator [Collimonas sp.]|uniref:helix-turn-helix domain-containing protein n=1 Tax=Collimonas sp. TaxID=1963772 RepID=UPI003266F829
MSFNANCGERLREERDRLGFTQQEMADRMGVRREMSSKYERGQAAPGGNALTEFAAAGGDVQYVLTGQRSNNAMSPDEKELLTGYRGLDIRGKAGVLGMIDGMSDPKQPPTATAPAIVNHGEVGQQITGGINAPQTFYMGSDKRANDKKSKKKLVK